jgi:hypothetical protein
MNPLDFDADGTLRDEMLDAEALNRNREDEMRYRARLRALFFIQEGSDKLNPNCSSSALIQAFYSHEWAARNELPK